MKYLRQVWRSRGGTHRRAALLFVSAALWGSAAQAAPHAHARRPLPTHLHSTAIENGSSHPAGSGRGKAGATKQRSGAHPAAVKSHGGNAPQGKASKKSGRHKAEPVDDDAPVLLRAHGGSGAHGRHAVHQGLVRDTGDGGRGMRGRDRARLAAREPASHASAHFAVAPARRGEMAPRLTPVRVPAARAVIGTDNDRGDHYVPRHVAAHTVTPATAFSEGVSRPDEDGALPAGPGRGSVGVRGQDAVAGRGVEGPLVGRISAAPPATGSSRTSPVVQGFGGELAMAPADPGVRPGGTRRRGHPATYVPQSFAAAPEALEEREQITTAAVGPAVLPLTYDRDGRLQVLAPMRGSRLILAHQNQMATSDGLERIQDDADLDRLRAAHLLISFPATDALHVNDELAWNRRCARPWAVAFANDMAQAYYMHFHQPLTVTSAVRTVRYQARLQMVNGNAAATSGDLASPHLTGQAIDFAKRGMATAELAWMRGYLTPLMQAGKIDVEEEFQQACFHISIYRSYLAGRHVAPSRALAQAREIGSGNSAAANPASVAAPLESGLPSTPSTALPPLDH